MSRLRFDLHAAGVLAPGIASLAELRVACRNGQRAPMSTPALVLPEPALLPPNERRRATEVVRLTLACIEQALQSCPFPRETLRSVFATDEGTGDVCQKMLEVLATTRQLSPLLFTNSVHNAASGYFSIATRNRQSSTVISLGLESFASGLLCAVCEATSLHQPVLLVSYDPAMKPPMDELLPVTEPIATAWILSEPAAFAEPPALGAFELEIAPAGTAEPTPLPCWLPPSWRLHSSAQALAALELLEADCQAVQRLGMGGALLSLRRLDVAAE